MARVNGKLLKSMLWGVLAIAICGCQYSGNADVSGEALQMPDIVFLYTIDYEAYRYDDDYDGPDSAITFYDKNGDHYTSNDEYVCSLPFDKLCEEYVAGKLDDKIKYHMSCDRDELYENYRKLCKASKKDVHIVYPKEIPEWITNREMWYGLYYDNEGNIQKLNIHEYDADDFYTDNVQVNEIYEWYMGTFKKNKDLGDAATPQKADDSKPKEKFATRVISISDAYTFDVISEKAHMDEIMSITDILDNEEGFFVINDADKPDIRAVYLYYIYDELYEKCIFPVDYSKNEVIAAYFLKRPGGRVYVLCPEYTVVEAITTPDSDAAKEVGTFIPDEIYDDVNKARTLASDEASDNVEPYGEREVGGEPMFRIYEVDPDAKDSIRFVIHSSSEPENTEEWGSFVIDCDRLEVDDNEENEEPSGTFTSMYDDNVHELSADETKMIHDMLSNYKWNNEGVAESIDDIDFIIYGQDYRYSSSCGCFNDYEGKRFLQLSDKNAAKVNVILSGYVTLE